MHRLQPLLPEHDAALRLGARGLYIGVSGRQKNVGPQYIWEIDKDYYLIELAGSMMRQESGPGIVIGKVLRYLTFKILYKIGPISDAALLSNVVVLDEIDPRTSIGLARKS